MPIVVQPPVVTMLVVLSAWLIHALLDPWQTILRVPVLGGVLVVLGFSCMMWARILFTSRHTTLFVGRPSSQLVREGPFRFSRNPMYVGVLVFLVGLALWVGTWPFYLTVPVTFLFLNFFHIPREEGMLRELFGERYLHYSQEVRRWL
jgi:protein-S-isoprenylcysteine O-methyltransferase Ste14